MGTWNLLESILGRVVLPEERMYRGETLVRMKDLRSLFKKLRGDPEKGAAPATSDPKVNSDPDPNGGMIVCQYSVDPRVWGRWTPNLGQAVVLAGTDKKDTQYVGQAKGNTVHKMNYHGRVVTTPGNPGKDFEQQPSAMDRYDILMVAEVQGGIIQPGQPVNWPPGQKEGMPKIVVQKIVWSPAIGDSQARMQRLQDLLAGKAAQPLARRPQPELPQPHKDLSADVPAPHAVPRQGQGRRPPREEG